MFSHQLFQENHYIARTIAYLFDVYPLKPPIWREKIGSMHDIVQLLTIIHMKPNISTAELAEYIYECESAVWFNGLKCQLVELHKLDLVAAKRTDGNVVTNLGTIRRFDNLKWSIREINPSTKTETQIKKEIRAKNKKFMKKFAKRKTKKKGVKNETKNS